jgi:hypothetical protein
MDESPRNEQAQATRRPGVPKRLRRLKSDELVSVGDFVANESNEFELWEGPQGFLADSFIKPIYRRAVEQSLGGAREQGQRGAAFRAL